MQEILDLVWSYARSIWLRKWHVLIVAWLLCIVGWVFVYQLPDQYQASSKVHIDTRSFLRPVLKGLLIKNSDKGSVSLMVQTLLSRPNLEKVARITDLDLRATTDAEMDILLADLKSKIKVTQLTRRSNLYEISYVDENRALTKKVVDAIINVLVERSLGENREDSVSASRFLDSEIQSYEARLREAEQKLVNFKRKNIEFLSSTGGNYYTGLQNAMAELEAAKLNLSEAINQRNAIQEQLENEEEAEESLLFGSGAISGSATTSYDPRIQSLQLQMDDLLIRFTEKHPDVVTIKAQIADLEAKRVAELAAFKDADVDPENPMIQSLKLSLNQANAQVAALKVRTKNFEGKVKRLEELVHIHPSIEAELSAVNRDYSVIKSKYDQLLERREQAKITQKASQSSDDVEFKIVEPARVPTEAAGPNRILFSSIVLLLSIAIGIGYALFLAIIKPTFNSAKGLALATGLPVLGIVSRTQSAGEIAIDRRGLFIYLAASFVLLVFYAGLMLMQLLPKGIL